METRLPEAWCSRSTRRNAPLSVGVFRFAAVRGPAGSAATTRPLANRVLPLIVDALPRAISPADQRGGVSVASVGGGAVGAVEETGLGRRIHDLRHTAACLWLARGVDAVTVQAWMGHESIATTNRYLHHLGTAADSAGLARLNASAGGIGGAQASGEDE